VGFSTSLPRGAEEGRTNCVGAVYGLPAPDNGPIKVVALLIVFVH
jgi:hypothetical protein